MVLLLALLACAEVDPAAPAAGSNAGPAPTSSTSAPDAAPALGSSKRAGPALLPASSTVSGGWEHFGTDFTTAPESTLRCETLLADPAAHVNQTVRVTGRVADVCQAKGCWMVLTPKDGGEQMMRVTMKDHAFSVDKQGHGREAELEGVLIAKTVDPETVAHYEGEAGAEGKVPEKQATGGVSYELVASAVRFRNPG